MVGCSIACSIVNQNPCILIHCWPGFNSKVWDAEIAAARCRLLFVASVQVFVAVLPFCLIPKGEKERVKKAGMGGKKSQKVVSSDS